MTAEEFKQNIIPFFSKLYPMINRILKGEEESEDAVQLLMLFMTQSISHILNLNFRICLDLG